MNRDKQFEKILLVDDEQIVRSTVSKYLHKMGYDIETAEDGKIAIEKLENNYYDLVLTDLNMPNIDGRDLLQYMAAKLPEIPKIVLTGYGEDKDIIIALKAGANDFLYKPIGDFAILHHSIKKALDIKKAQNEKDRYFKQIHQINDIISLLNKGKSTEEIFKSLSISLKKIIPFNRISLMIIDRQNNKLIVKLVDSDRKTILKEGFSIFFDANIIDNHSFDVEHRIIEDLTTFTPQNLVDPNLPKHDLIIEGMLIEEGMRSSLILPLIINNICRGFLHLASIVPKFFQKEHITFMESIVGHISLSIERGELIDDLENHTKNLEQLVEQRTSEIFKTQRTTLFALSKLAESRDPETGEHLERIRRYSILTAQIYKYSQKENNITNTFLRDLYDSSILHDIGKVGIPDTILRKTSPLNPDEIEIIKNHIYIGYEALKSASKDLGENSFLKMAMEIILYHHERWDGTGYPKGLRGEEIPLSARIVAISDVYDALKSKRPYKRAYTHEESIEIMQKTSSYFDPTLFQIFIDNSLEYDIIGKQFMDK